MSPPPWRPSAWLWPQHESRRHLDCVPADVPVFCGGVIWSEQVGRMLLLAAGTALSVAIVDRARRYAHPMTIGVLDLDYFKGVNDRYGHAAGDEALRRFADILRESFRRTDIVARYGREKFAITLPETDAVESQAKFDQIRRYVESTPVRVGRDATEVYLTFSAGIAHHPDDGDATPDLVGPSDANLLFAKREGRNRVRGSGGTTARSE